jgi:hypothetical protein
VRATDDSATLTTGHLEIKLASAIALLGDPFLIWHMLD